MFKAFKIALRCLAFQRRGGKRVLAKGVYVLFELVDQETERGKWRNLPNEAPEKAPINDLSKGFLRPLEGLAM